MLPCPRRDSVAFMADIDILAADLRDGRVQSLTVRFKNAAPRKIDRATALHWLAEGHSLIPVSGHGHEVHRGHCLERVELGDTFFLRTDTAGVAADQVTFAH